MMTRSTLHPSHRIRLPGLAAALVLSFGVVAQDIHFSQFFNAPLALGPGMIGQFDGEYRANGIFRQQWRSVTVPYRTFGLGGDAQPESQKGW